MSNEITSSCRIRIDKPLNDYGGGTISIITDSNKYLPSNIITL